MYFCGKNELNMEKKLGAVFKTIGLMIGKSWSPERFTRPYKEKKN